jgi:hypothetical protein
MTCLERLSFHTISPTPQDARLSSFNKFTTYQTAKTGRNFPVYLEGDLPSSPLREDGSICGRGF